MNYHLHYINDCRDENPSKIIDNMVAPMKKICFQVPAKKFLRKGVDKAKKSCYNDSEAM
jgi:hypothetical protein